jgi:hypothetical protein
VFIFHLVLDGVRINSVVTAGEISAVSTRMWKPSDFSGNHYGIHRINSKVIWVSVEDKRGKRKRKLNTTV